MNTVKRYSVEATGMGLHLEGHAVGTIERVVVMASDFDAAPAREVALQEELRLAKRLQTTTDAIVIMVNGQRDHWIEKHNALQQRLTVEDQREAELTGLLKLSLLAVDDVAESCEDQADWATANSMHALSKRITAALKPAAEGEGS